MEYLVEMKNMTMKFPGVVALNKVSFNLRPGEVHVLLGENGAGKSTLVKMLSGINKPTEGEIVIGGKTYSSLTPKESAENKIAIIYQELSVVDELTIAENLYVGKLPYKKLAGLKLVDYKYMNGEAKKYMDEIGLKKSPSTLVQDISISEKQQVEIAKALAAKARIIIMDEPTSSLSIEETEELFRIIRRLKENGIGIIYISHKLKEIKEIGDRVTVLKDGGYVGTLITKDSTKDDIINMMVGRVIYEDPKTQSNVPADAPVVLKVEHLNAGKMVRDVSFELHKGEILGFSGLMGAGRTETARALFGADPMDSGDIYVNGQKVTIKSPMDAVKCGIGYLSEDRKRYGIVVQKSVAENSTMVDLDNYVNGIFINKKKENDVALKYVKSLKTKTPSVDQLVVNLSGGNQQKVVIAKWLIRNCDILIFDEPTRGIDVGAKSEIYHLMNELAAKGKSIIMISSEMTEILRMSDRIVVMCEGRKTGELDIAEATQENIMHAATMRD